MVPYAVDKKIRVVVVFFIAVGAVALALKAGTITKGKAELLAPSGLTLFFLLHLIFDKFLWHLPVINHLIGIPNFSGRWEGSVTVAGESLNTPCVLFIVQDWSNISIRLETETTASRTIVAALRVNDPNSIQLRFAYEVRRIKGPSTRRGDGFNTLELRREADVLELSGPYFSDATYGASRHTGFVSVKKC